MSDETYEVSRDFLLMVDEMQVGLRRTSEAVPSNHWDVNRDVYIELADEARRRISELGLGDGDE